MAEQSATKHTEKYEFQHLPDEFLPNLCQPGSVLSLILVGELLALALALDDSGLRGFSWMNFALQSFLIQWILLTTAATLCMLRNRLNALGAAKALGISFVLVLVYTCLFTMAGLAVLLQDPIDLYAVLGNMGIAAIFAGVLLRYLYLQQRLKQQQQAEQEARIQALQSRIRPHFLFNSLNSIASLIAIRPEEAEKLVVDLAQLFRASLKLPKLTDMQDELVLSRSFCNIEKVRLGRRLQLNWHIGDLPKGAQILNLLIQPLIENAIYHGIQPLPSGGEVDIDINEKDGYIILKITNPVLPEYQRSKLDQDRGNGIALANIRSRLAAFYGDKAYLRVVKGQTDFTVLVRYPADKQGVE
ncbi:sensor histidine kinase [Agaribacterium sp. ZY112]|uniref:sensor histidine kinase n=1 Tax=Agaribacterium sp. ZY112 TaxID=3233574 RepID=UPI0035236DDA